MPNREYSTSLDYQIDGISIVPARTGSKADPIIIHDGSKGIVRWGGIAIYEDMFRNFTTCEITLEDVDGFYLNRLRSEEVLVVQFKTPDLPGRKFEKRKHYFYIYKIDPVIFEDRPPKAFYTIRGISFEYFANALTTFSRSYKGKTEQIASEIYHDFLEIKSQKASKKALRVGRSTKNEMKFVFPYMNPVDAINHLASVSIDESNPEICNYVFFENKDGFNFLSITEMIENPRKTHKYQTSKIMRDSITDYAAHFDKTISVNPRRTGDKIIDTLDGVYGEYFSEYDILYKTFKPFISNEPNRTPSWGKRYLDSFPKTQHLNKFPLLSDDNELFQYPLGRNRVCFTNAALHSERIPLAGGKQAWKLYDTHEGEYSFQRRSMMQQINTFSVELTVSGNSDITVGDIVEYDGSIYNTVEKDRYISGKYLVTAVNHFISRDGYKSIVTISRDSVISDGSEPDATPGA
jgi:hypothetical protein